MITLFALYKCFQVAVGFGMFGILSGVGHFLSEDRINLSGSIARVALTHIVIHFACIFLFVFVVSLAVSIIWAGMPSSQELRGL